MVRVGVENDSDHFWKSETERDSLFSNDNCYNFENGLPLFPNHFARDKRDQENQEEGGLAEKQ